MTIPHRAEDWRSDAFGDDNVAELSFAYAVRDLAVWQKVIVSILGAGVLGMFGVIGREFYYAINPDRRPRKRKRKSRKDDLPE
jgi:hypothetical protein